MNNCTCKQGSLWQFLVWSQIPCVNFLVTSEEFYGDISSDLVLKLVFFFSGVVWMSTFEYFSQLNLP